MMDSVWNWTPHISTLQGIIFKSVSVWDSYQLPLQQTPSWESVPRKIYGFNCKALLRRPQRRVQRQTKVLSSTSECCKVQRLLKQEPLPNKNLFSEFSCKAYNGSFYSFHLILNQNVGSYSDGVFQLLSTLAIKGTPKHSVLYSHSLSRQSIIQLFCRT